MSSASLRQVIESGLELSSAITILVGDNGSGKSTLIEAVADQFGINSRGGRAAVMGGNAGTGKSALGNMLSLSLTDVGRSIRRAPRHDRHGFFLRAETAWSLQQDVSGVRGYWSEDTDAMSHGEGFQVMIESMFRGRGLYLLDEPESALSFNSTLWLGHHLRELARAGSQIICATHSPILASIPGSDIVELGEFGCRRSAWQDLELVKSWQGFLARPHLHFDDVTSQGSR